jgi:hypothetical protein
MDERWNEFTEEERRKAAARAGYIWIKEYRRRSDATLVRGHWRKTVGSDAYRQDVSEDKA